MKLKRLLLILTSILMLSSVSTGASLSLKATWDLNTEPDMKEYRLYRIDIPRQLIGVSPHPVNIYEFTVDVPDNTEGELKFVLTAVDTSGNESQDSNIAIFPFDLKPPAVPGGLRITVR